LLGIDAPEIRGLNLYYLKRSGFLDILDDQLLKYLQPKLTKESIKTHKNLGFEAKDYLESILEEDLLLSFGKEVFDRYERLLVYLSATKGKSYNVLLIQARYALPYLFYPNAVSPTEDGEWNYKKIEEIQKATIRARTHNLGIWAHIDILLPMELRFLTRREIDDDTSFMNDLRQLLRYEIPGILTIVYFLILSYPFLSESAQIDSLQADNRLLGLTAILVTLALPLGFVVYSLYQTLEEEGFLKKRIGMNVVEQILDEHPAPDEKKWWNSKCRKSAERNEILDIVFYGSRETNATGSTDILERLINFHHAGKVIGMYTPLSAVALYLLFFVYECSSKSFAVYFLITGVIILLIFYSHEKMALSCFIFAIVDISLIFVIYIILFELFLLMGNLYIMPWSIAFDNLKICFVVISLFIIYSISRGICFQSSEIFCSGVLILIVINSLVVSYMDNLSWIVTFSILTTSLLTIPKTLQNGLLKKQMDELEVNILLSRKQEIVETIRKRRDIS
jgi:endonuclease YncB( thermonuclease family)